MNKFRASIFALVCLLLAGSLHGSSLPDATDASDAAENYTYLRASLPKLGAELRFGVVPDTQGDDNGVASTQAAAIASFMIAESPAFVIHTGDLTDGSYEGDEKLVELEYFKEIMVKPLLDKGIRFYPVPGNHDSKVSSSVETDDGTTQSVWQTAFPYLFTKSRRDLVCINPADVPGASADTPNESNFSYVIDTGKNTFLVALDMWNGGDTANYGDWIAAKFEKLREAHPKAHIFAFSHSGPFSLGMHPAMSEYVGSPDAFIAAAFDYDADGWFSGHNHVYDRSVGIDDEGSTGFFDMTCGTASMSSTNHGLSRSPADDQRVNCVVDSTTTGGEPIACEIVSVNGPFVTVRTFMSPVSEDSSGNDEYADWSVWDQYTYSTNGRRFVVAHGGSYDDAFISDTAPGGGSYAGTSAAIVNGTNSDDTTYSYTARGSATATSFPRYRTIALGWIAKSRWYDGNRKIVSDILSVHGMSETVGDNRCDAYTLELTYPDYISDKRAASISLAAYLDYTGDKAKSAWQDAVAATDSDFARYPAMRAPEDDEAVGAWGIDTASHTVWARLDYQGDFALALDKKRSCYWPTYEKGAKWDDVMGWIEDTGFPWVWSYTGNGWYYVYQGTDADMTDGYWIAWFPQNFKTYGWGYVLSGEGWWKFARNLGNTWYNPDADYDF